MPTPPASKPFVAPPGWEQLTMDKCRPGMAVMITKAETDPIHCEIWTGVVRQVSKPNRWTLLVYVPHYALAGRIRDRWKPKVVRFANSSQHKVYYDTSRWTTEHQQQQAKRHAYKDARKLFSQARDAVSAAFQLLGLQPTCTADEFKQVKRAMMRKYHEDVLIHRIREDPTQEAALRQYAQRYLDAVARLDHYIKARDDSAPKQLDS